VPAVSAGAVVYVKDLQRMTAFYERCFGLTVADAEPDRFGVLTAGAWELALVAAPQAIAAALVITDPPARRTSAPTKLAFEVEAIEALRTLVARLGGQLEPPDRAWTFRGFRQLDGLDPEGNVVQLRERATAR
jgi:predicted enzyme related to lactoylglutathione lyase